MKEEAAANAEADKKEKERIDKLNQADSMISRPRNNWKILATSFRQTRKLRSKVPWTNWKKLIRPQDIAGIDAAMAELNSVFQAASQEMYNAQGGGAQGGPQADPTSVVNKLAVMQVAATTAKTVTLRTLTLRKWSKHR